MYLITGNAGKFAEFQALIPDLEQLDIDLEEIQELDPQKIIAHKLAMARQHTEEPCIVDDTAIFFSGLQGLPGPLAKWFLKTIGLDGLYQLAVTFNNFHATAQATLGYCSVTGEYHFFVGQLHGTIVSPRGEHGFGWDAIFQPDGSDKTFAEMTIEEKNHFSHRRLAINKLLEFLNK